MYLTALLNHFKEAIKAPAQGPTWSAYHGTLLNRSTGVHPFTDCGLVDGASVSRTQKDQNWLRDEINSDYITYYSEVSRQQRDLLKVSEAIVDAAKLLFIKSGEFGGDSIPVGQEEAAKNLKHLLLDAESVVRCYQRQLQGSAAQ